MSPAIAPVASGFQPGLRSPPSSGRNVRPCASGSRGSSCSTRERPLEPGEEVAAVGDRAALDHAALVARSSRRARRAARLALVQDAVGARGADHQRRSVRRRAAGAEVRAGAVAERRVASCRPARRRSAAAAARRARARRAARRPTPVRAGRAGPSRTRSRASSAARRSAGGRGSRRTRRPAAPRRACPAPSSHASFAGQKLGCRKQPVRSCTATGSSRARELLGLRRRAPVLPEEHGRQRPVALVEQEQAVPEAGDPGRVVAACPPRRAPPRTRDTSSSASSSAEPSAPWRAS